MWSLGLRCSRPRVESGLRGLKLSAARATVVVERWWQVPLPKEGKPARLHPRRHRVYRLVEDTKTAPPEKMQVLLTQTVPKLGDRGEVVEVKKSLGRNRLLPRGLAVYASPQNLAALQRDQRLREEGKPEERTQTPSGERTVELLRGSVLTVRMKNNVKWELSKEVVCRHFLKELRLSVPPEAVRIPDEPITRWGEHWCEVTVNGVDTVRLPMSVVQFERLKTRRYKQWLSHQEPAGAQTERDGEEES